MRPRPYTFKAINTLFADYVSGAGIMSNGEYVRPKVGPRRQKPNLQDMLDTAAEAGAERIMFTGKVPPNERETRHWLMVQTPGWNPGWMGPNGEMQGHWLASPPTGRFERQQTGQRIEVRVASEWFGSTEMNPREARDAWDATAYLVGKAFDGLRLGKSPAATGSNLWAASLPRDVELGDIPDDIALELHRTSGQHHLEHLVAGPSFSTHEDCTPLVDPAKTPRLERFAYVDGRFMYAALCRELGTGPATRLNRADTADLIESDPYARARVWVKFTVPPGWNHVGIFGVQHPRAEDGWYYPNRPGATGETWADLAEIQIARRFGWIVEPVESVVFAKTRLNRDGKAVAIRPLDTFSKRIIRIREIVDEDPEMSPKVKAGVSAALRAIMISTIGSFASRGRGSTVVAWSPQDVPPQYMNSMVRRGQAWVYTVPAPMTTVQRAYYRPELAVQVWARGRARVLLGPSKLGPDTAGALTVPSATLLGINGDAIYTSYVPDWALPVQHGGGDDGAVGRLRLQGMLENVKTPSTKDERDKLRLKAVRNGVDSAFFDTEYHFPED